MVSLSTYTHTHTETDIHTHTHITYTHTHIVITTHIYCIHLDIYELGYKLFTKSRKLAQLSPSLKYVLVKNSKDEV